jgi:hypothetical protein
MSRKERTACHRNDFSAYRAGRPCAALGTSPAIWGDEKKWRSAYRLDRDRFALSIVNHELLGYEGWLNYGLLVGADSEGEIAAPAESATGDL